MSGFVFAFISLLAFGSSTLFLKKPLENLSVPTVLFFKYFFASILTLASVLIFSHVQFPSPGLLPVLIFEIVIGSIAIIAFYKAIQIGRLSVVYPFAEAHVLLVVLAGVFFFKETFSILQWIAALLVITGVLALVTQKFNFRELEAGIGYAFITFFCWGIFFSVIKFLTIELDAFNIAFYGETGIFLIVLIYLFFTRQSIHFNHPETKFMLANASLTTLGYVAFVSAVPLMGIALTSLIAAPTPMVLAILSYIFLHERLPVYKYLAIIVIVIGLALIAVG